MLRARYLPRLTLTLLPLVELVFPCEGLRLIGSVIGCSSSRHAAVRVCTSDLPRTNRDIIDTHFFRIEVRRLRRG